jgi:hypothetical protein
MLIDGQALSFMVTAPAAAAPSTRWAFGQIFTGVQFN